MAERLTVAIVRVSVLPWLLLVVPEMAIFCPGLTDVEKSWMTILSGL